MDFFLFCFYKKVPKVQLIQILRNLCQQKSALLFSNSICMRSHEVECRVSLLQESGRSSVSQCWGSQAHKMFIRAQCCNGKIHQKLDLPKQCQELTPQQDSALLLLEEDSCLTSIWCCVSCFWWELTKRRWVLLEFRQESVHRGKQGTRQRCAWDRAFEDRFRKKSQNG